MKNTLIFLNHNKILVIFIVIAGLLFYWYSYRPIKIRENCAKEANFNAKGREVGFDYLENQKVYNTAYDSAYKECLNLNGL